MNATDLLGQKLEIGDVICYPRRQGSSLWMNFGKIYSLEWNPPYQPYPESNPNYIQDGFWDCKVIVKSEDFYYIDNQYMSDTDKKQLFIQKEISLGRIPANLDSCYICYPRKTPVGLDRAIKINPDQLTEIQVKVLLNEEWTVDKIRLK